MAPQNSKSLEHWANAKPGFMNGIHVFLYNKFLYQNELQNSWDLKKMLRKSPASNAWTANFQKCIFFLGLFKTYKKKVNLTFFSDLKLFSVFVVNCIIILFSKHGNIKRWNIELRRFSAVINKFLDIKENEEIKVKKTIKKKSA